ncbi:acyltransferase [Micromonospora sp. KC213]|uniref:acyltransferase family protein n=1 Tax=Micromonospora sp. KC213 TaxID=2530378 RepID=UPI001053D120|nr:acyltransferase [Micromonospora sp. KC213]TDC42296.1 acyltransferase [Micromonospora sp. KC213]
MSEPVKPAQGGRQAGAPGWSPALEGLRAVAVLGVLVHHVSYLSGLTTAPGHFGGLLARLDVGVTLFFALSGFLLYRPFAAATIDARPQPPVGRYLWHRALRILPGYWAMAVVALVWLNIDYLHSVRDWAIPLLLVHIYQPLQLPVGMEQTWSLATEAAFYLALPLFAVLGRRMGGRTPRARARRQLILGVLLIMAGLVWNVYAHGPGAPLPMLAVLWLPAYLDWFGLGMVLAVLASWPVSAAETPVLSGFYPGASHSEPDPWLATPRGLRVITFAPGTSWLIAGVLLWIASTPIAGPRGVEAAGTVESLTEHLLFAMVVWFVIAPLVGPRTGRLPHILLGHPVVRFLGRISYGIFLWHLLAIEVCLRLLGFTRFNSSFWGLLLLSLALTIPAAAASYYLIEWPLQWLRRHVDARTRRPEAEPEPPSRPLVDAGEPTPVPALQGAASTPPGQPALSAGLVTAPDPAVPQHQGGHGDQ